MSDKVQMALAVCYWLCFCSCLWFSSGYTRMEKKK